MKRTWIVGILVCLAMAPFLSRPAGAQAPFYEGKTITIMIGTQGGGSLVAARILARHLGKYIPGNPTVIVQPMTGAAHIVATNHVYGVAKPDGLTLLAANPNIGIAQLIKVEAVRFDAIPDFMEPIDNVGWALQLALKHPEKWIAFTNADTETVYRLAGMLRSTSWHVWV